MNQIFSEIPVPATATDGGSLIGAVENTDDRWLRMMSGGDSENATHTGLDGASSSMNQAVSEIPVPATATDGGSLSGAVENTDDSVAMDVIRGTENVSVVFGLTYYSATYFYANELDNSSQPEMKHPKLEKGKRSQGDFKELLGLHEALEVLLDHHGNLN
nr:hypothetical protein CFP56_26627 [Quercus suber]